MDSKVWIKRTVVNTAHERVVLCTLAISSWLLSGCGICAQKALIDTQKAVARELHVGSSEDEVKHFCAAHGMDYKRTSEDIGSAGKILRYCNDPSKPLLGMEIRFDSNNRATAFEVTEMEITW